MRRNIYDVLKNGKIDIKREYSRIYDLFFVNTYGTCYYDGITLESVIIENFNMLNVGVIGRCLSLDDFNESYGYHFVPQPNNLDINMLVDISEYVVNFAHALMCCGKLDLNIQTLFRIEQHIDSCMEDVGYKQVMKENILIYVENNPVALSVAETVESALAYSVLEYNHHKMKGDLVNKKNILKNMADDIENERKTLDGINKGFTSDLFQLFNKFVRHDNSDNSFILSLSDESIEEIYDDIYQMWLLAKMYLEQVKRNGRVAEIIQLINEN